MDRDPGHAPRRAALPRAPVPFRDPFYQNEVIDCITVVGHPSLGGRRMGACHRRYFRVHPDEDNGRGQAGRGEVAVRGDRPLSLHRHRRDRPSLLLDRRAEVLALGRRVFSALEPLPIVLMLIDTMNHVKHRKKRYKTPSYGPMLSVAPSCT